MTIMADLSAIVQSPDHLTRSVWIVVDPRDLVTGQRVTAPLRVRLDGQSARPIATVSGVYCFTDLNVAAGNYTVQVEPLTGNRGQYFRATQPLNLVVVPVPGNPLQRNPITIQLLPRPAYPFGDGATLARGRLVKASDMTALEGALVRLFIGASDEGVRTQTDERGEFAVLFPTPAPATSGGPKTFTFTLRFILANHPDHDTGAAQVGEGKTKALGEIQFPGM
jgi:hypothetical protein